MTDITELKETREAAERALRDAQRAKEMERRALVNNAEELIDRDMAAKHDPGIDAFASTLQAATAAHDAALDAAAREGAGAPYPIGTRFVQRDFVRWPGRYQKGATGVLEAITKDSEHPGNISGYRTAKLGSYVIRILKKDGSRSKKYKRWHSGWSEEVTNKPPYGWHPEGFDPNTTIEKE